MEDDNFDFDFLSDSDDDTVYRDLFADSGEEEDDFEGFDPEDVEACLLTNATRAETPIHDHPMDRIFAADEHIGWKKEDCDMLLHLPFEGVPGLNRQPEGLRPLDFFYLLFNRTMWDLIVEQTNLYAQQCRPNVDDLPRFSYFRQWTPVTVHEMMVFFALVILMGLIIKPDLDAYWTTDTATATPMFGKHMSRNRFMSILSNLHLTDNSTQPPVGTPAYDKLCKVRPFVTMMKRNFCEVYSPEQYLSFDEGCCPWKGRLSWRVYNPKKPNKFHMKLFQVCEASSGYILGFDVYTGSTECAMFAETVGVSDEAVGDSITAKVVVGLLAYTGLVGKGHFIYMDNFYSSPVLFDELNLLDTYCCGTLRSNRRQVPEAIKQVKLKNNGDTVFRRRDNLLALKHHDKRDVCMLSTIHQATYVVVDQRVQGGQLAQVLKPTCIYDYIKRMGGVDTSDQMLQYYSVFRKTTKYWRKLFLHLFNMIITNAFILQKKYGTNDKLNHYDFRLSLVYALLDEAVEAPKPQGRGRKVNVDEESVTRLSGRHFPDHIPAKEGAKRARPARDCAACNAAFHDREGFKRKQTTFMCKVCNVALCVPRCFEVYHTHKDFKRILRQNADE